MPRKHHPGGRREATRQVIALAHERERIWDMILHTAGDQRDAALVDIAIYSGRLATTAAGMYTNGVGSRRYAAAEAVRKTRSKMGSSRTMPELTPKQADIIVPVASETLAPTPADELVSITATAGQTATTEVETAQ